MVRKAPVFEKEKVIDRRIGIRLKSIFWPLDRTAITDILTALNYKNFAVSREGSLNAIKQNTEFYTDYTRLVLGFHNPTINTLIEAQKEFFSVAQRDFKASIEKYVRFYEIDCTSNYISDKNSLSAISSVDENLQIKRDFEEIIGEPLQISKLHFTKRGEDNRGDDWLSIDIEPRLESTGNVYFCRLIVRGQKIEPLFKFLRRSSEIFEKVINRLEK